MLAFRNRTLLLNGLNGKNKENYLSDLNFKDDRVENSVDSQKFCLHYQQYILAFAFTVIKTETHGCGRIEIILHIF